MSVQMIYSEFLANFFISFAFPSITLCLETNRAFHAFDLFFTYIEEKFLKFLVINVHGKHLVLSNIRF